MLLRESIEKFSTTANPKTAAAAVATFRFLTKVSIRISLERYRDLNPGRTVPIKH
jgi:hypothetical protein